MVLPVNYTQKNLFNVYVYCIMYKTFWYINRPIKKKILAEKMLLSLNFLKKSYSRKTVFLKNSKISIIFFIQFFLKNKLV